MVEEKFAAVFHARLDNQARASPLAKLWNEISRHMTIVGGHDGTHWATVTVACPPQNIGEVGQQLGFQHPDEVKD